ncbi:MAG: Fpg/Nei family DNA glycosylase [Candidatus Saccharimonadales bacterium]
MPELPEVETIRRGLARLLVSKIIREVSSDTPKSFPNAPRDVDAFVIGAHITTVKRRAKVLLIELSSGYTLVTHLKMTGQLVFIKEGSTPPLDPEINSGSSSHPLKLAHSARAGARHMGRPQDREYGRRSGEATLRFGGGHPTDSLIGALPDKTTRVEITFQDESRLFFNDLRKFGWMKLVPTIAVPEIDFIRTLGPEPLEDSFTSDMLYERLQRRKNTSIKAALLDQTVLAGIGNIYADESLWGAQIHPVTPVRLLPKSKIQNLTSEIKAVLLLSLAKGGSTDKNYIDAEGNRGSYLSFARVFRREGEACPRCGTTIEKLRVAGRGTHVCPRCQQKYS